LRNRRIIQVCQIVNLFNLEHYAVAIAEILELTGSNHLLDLVLGLAKSLSGLIQRVKHLRHV
jgi:hypothetical protein